MIKFGEICIEFFSISFTFISEPTQPGTPYSVDVESQNMSFNYLKPEYENGIITHQEIEYTHLPYNACAADSGKKMTAVENEILPVDMSDKIWTFSLKELKPFWEYTIRVRVNTSAGFSNFSESITIRTPSSSKFQTLSVLF